MRHSLRPFVMPNGKPEAFRTARRQSRAIGLSLRYFCTQRQLAVSQPANQQLALVNHLGLEPIVKVEKQLFVSKHFVPPSFAIECLQLFKSLFRKIAPLPFNVFVMRYPPDWRFLSERATVRTVDDPLQHAHVFAETRPHEVPILVFAEPVHMKDLRRFRK